MGNTRSKLFLLFFIVIIDNSVNSDKLSSDDEKVLMVTPVLGPHRNARANAETAKEFPILMLLAGDDKRDDVSKVNSTVTVSAVTEENLTSIEPVYIQKLEDQKPVKHPRKSKLNLTHI